MWNPITFAVFYLAKKKSTGPTHTQGKRITQECECQKAKVIGGHLRGCPPQLPGAVVAMVTLMCEDLQNHKLEHREAWVFLMHLRYRFIHLSLLLSKYFQCSNCPCPGSMSISDLAAAQPMKLHGMWTHVILRSQSKRCGDAFSWGLNDVNEESGCLFRV